MAIRGLTLTNQAGECKDILKKESTSSFNLQIILFALQSKYSLASTNETVLTCNT